MGMGVRDGHMTTAQRADLPCPMFDRIDNTFCWYSKLWSGTSYRFENWQDCVIFQIPLDITVNATPGEGFESTYHFSVITYTSNNQFNLMLTLFLTIGSEQGKLSIIFN